MDASTSSRPARRRFARPVPDAAPSFSAEPDGMLSVHINHAVTLLLQRKAFNADIVANTAAAPLMSIFIASMPSDGFRLSPPESNMTPLPTRPRWPFGSRGVYTKRTMRGGSTDASLVYGSGPISSPPICRSAFASVCRSPLPSCTSPIC